MGSTHMRAQCHVRDPHCDCWDRAAPSLGNVCCSVPRASIYPKRSTFVFPIRVAIPPGTLFIIRIKSEPGITAEREVRRLDYAPRDSAEDNADVETLDTVALKPGSPKGRTRSGVSGAVSSPVSG